MHYHLFKRIVLFPKDIHRISVAMCSNL